MRLFRTWDAAKTAGHSYLAVMEGRCAPYDVLTDRERALLEALERVLPMAWRSKASDNNDDDIDALEAAEALIRELAVEG